MSFSCDRCGLCCRRVGRFPFMKEYDRGDGVCKHLTQDNLCAIYENRPVICNTDLLYEKFYSSSMSREEYDLMNSGACASMKSSSTGNRSGIQENSATGNQELRPGVGVLDTPAETGSVTTPA